MSELLKKLQQDEKFHREHLNEVLRQIDKEKKRIIKETYSVEPGCVIKDDEDNEYLVASVGQSWGDSAPWVRAYAKNKSGQFGKALRHVYGKYTVVSSPQPSMTEQTNESP